MLNKLPGEGFKLIIHNYLVLLLSSTNFTVSVQVNDQLGCGASLHTPSHCMRRYLLLQKPHPTRPRSALERTKRKFISPHTHVVGLWMQLDEGIRG